ncbi:MAG TPA: prepilin peptidase, partial [Planctomycetota bacterium]|nr:prepilin peptidase [Planctomycetota bacterium]
MAENQRLVLLVFSGLLGLNIGSFLNVCIFRLPRNCMSIVKPRSRCPRCLNGIAWFDNLPVLSWCALG